MTERLTLPVLPLREVVLFPGVTHRSAPAARERCAPSRPRCKTDSRLVFAVSQRENVENVTPDVLYTIGTIARIGQIQRGLAGVQLLLHGERRGIAMHYTESEGYLERSRARRRRAAAARSRGSGVRRAAPRGARARRRAGPEVAACPRRSCSRCSTGVDEPGRFADLVAGYIDITAGRAAGAARDAVASRSACAACSCTCSGRSACSTRRRTSSRRSRRSWASGSARCTCASR